MLSVRSAGSVRLPFWFSPRVSCVCVYGRRTPAVRGRLAAGGRLRLSLPEEALGGLDPPGQAWLSLRPDGIEDEADPNKYRSGATINVSMWDMIEKKFREPGQERTLQGGSGASPGEKKRTAGDRKRDKKWREYQESLAAEVAQAAENKTKGGNSAPAPNGQVAATTPATPPLATSLRSPRGLRASPSSCT